MSLFSFFIAILPVFLIGLYIYKKDKIKESSKFLFKVFLFGIISCYPAIIVGSLFNFYFPEPDDMSFMQLFIYVFGTIAFVEELSKWFFLYKCTYNHEEFDSTYDMIVYASFVALGFACFENLMYVSSYDISVALLRAISAVPGHAVDGILMGIYLGIAKLKEVNGNKKDANKYKWLSIIVPTIAHGIYDFCIFNGTTVSIILFIIFVISIDIYCIIKLKNISKNNIKFKYNNNYCTNCGLIVTSNFCTRCGNKNKDLFNS